MAVQKFSQIALAPSAPASTDYLVGVTAGATDYRYTLAQVQTGVRPPPMVDTGIVYVPGLANVFTYTIPDNKWHVVFNGTMALTSGTVTMPANPINGQVVRVKTEQLIEAISFVGNAGQSIAGSPSVFPAFTYVEATYDGANTTWYVEFVAGALITLTAPLTLYVCILAGTIVGGSGYTPGTYGGPEIDVTAGTAPVPISLTGGSGTGATAIVIVGGGGAVTVVKPVAQGTGYLIGDVLSAATADLGGVGSGFTFTLTGVGNDQQTGTVLSTAFRTLNRANLEISNFNLATGFSVNVHVSDGYYDEQLSLTDWIGGNAAPVTWTGNLTRRENVQLQPRNDLGLGEILDISCPNVLMQGFWFDGTSPGMFSEAPVGNNNKGSAGSLQTCRISVRDNHFSGPYFFGGCNVNISDITYDWGGLQTNFLAQNGGFTGIGTGQVLNTTPAGPPSFLPFFFMEVITEGRVIIGGTAAGVWSAGNWAGALGQKFSVQDGSDITTQFAEAAAVPGSLPGTVAHSDCSLGSYFKDHSGNISDVSFGSPLRAVFPGAGDSTQFTFNGQWGVFFIQPTLTFPPVSADPHAFVLGINNDGSPLNVPLSDIINHQTGAGAGAYTLTFSDYGALIEMDNAGANTLTVPTNATVPFPVGNKIVRVVQVGAGATTIAAAGGVTGHNFGVLAGQWAWADLYQRATDEWVMLT